MPHLIAYVSALATLGVADFVWLSVTVPRFYRPAIRELLAPQISFPPAVVFYLLYPIGLLVFVIMPALKTADVRSAAFYGAFFGMICYATYDLTNQATLRGWPLALTMVDIAWGTTLSSFSAVCAFLAASRFS